MINGFPKFLLLPTGKVTGEILCQGRQQPNLSGHPGAVKTPEQLLQELQQRQQQMQPQGVPNAPDYPPTPGLPRQPQ